MPKVRTTREPKNHPKDPPSFEAGVENCHEDLNEVQHPKLTLSAVSHEHEIKGGEVPVYDLVVRPKPCVLSEPSYPANIATLAFTVRAPLPSTHQKLQNNAVTSYTGVLFIKRREIQTSLLGQPSDKDSSSAKLQQLSSTRVLTSLKTLCTMCFCLSRGTS